MSFDCKFRTQKCIYDRT